MLVSNAGNAGAGKESNFNAGAGTAELIKLS